MITLKAYSDVKFVSNHLIEQLSTYLSTRETKLFELDATNLTSEFNIAALREFESNQTSFRIRVSVAKDITTTNARRCNYLSLTSGKITRYYFVTSVEYISERVYDLVVALDVVNTYQSLISGATFRNVKMNRRMKDRWVKYNETYYRVYDKCDEGLGDIASQVEYNEDVNSESSYFATTTINDSDSLHLPFSIQLNKVYLDTSKTLYARVIKMTNDHMNVGTFNFTTSKSIRCLMYCDSSDDVLTGNLELYGVNNRTSLANAIYINATGTADNAHTYVYEGIYSNDIFIPLTKNDLGRVIGKNYLILNNMIGSGSFKILVENDIDVTGENLLKIGTHYNKSDIMNEDDSYSSTNYTKSANLLPISSLNKNDSNIQQINDVPFIPQTDDLIYMGENVGVIVKNVVKTTYTLDLNVSGSEPRHYTKNINKGVITRNMKNESKLYGSYVRSHQIVYDTFALPVQPEYYNGYIQSLSTTIYKPTGMSNDIAFKCNSLVQQSLNSNVMSCARNNQVTIYSNEYLNYLRNGYNYDEKSQALNKIKTGVNLAISVGSTAANIATAGAMGGLGIYSLVGAGTNTVSSLSSVIFSNIENDNALAQKRLSLINTSPTTSGSTSVNLFKELNSGNKLKYVTIRPSDAVLNATYNLFYFYGYKDNQTLATLTLNKTREYFDYYQGDAESVYSSNAIDGTQALELIKQALSEGITIEHKYNDTWLCQGALYENWEISI